MALEMCQPEVPTEGGSCENTFYSEKGCSWYESDSIDANYGKAHVPSLPFDIKSVRLRGQTEMVAYEGLRLTGKKVVQANMWPRITDPEARRNCLCFDLDDQMAAPFKIGSYELIDLTSSEDL